MHEIIGAKYDGQYLENKLGDPQFFSFFETS